MFKMFKPLEIVAAIYISAQITMPEQVIAQIEYIPVKTTDPNYNENYYYPALDRKSVV